MVAIAVAFRPATFAIGDATMVQMSREAGGPGIVVGTVVVMLLPIAVLLWDFSRGTVLQGHSAGIIAASLVFIFVIGLVIALAVGFDVIRNKTAN